MASRSHQPKTPSSSCQTRMEFELRECQRQLKQILDFSPDATFAIDLEGRITLWNRAMEKLTGRKAKDVLGKGNREYAIPFYGKRRPGIIELLLRPNRRFERTYSNFRRTREGVTAEIFFPNLRGRETYLWLIARPLYSPKGRVVGAIEGIRDITEHKKAEAALKESEEKYRSLVDHSLQGIVMATGPVPHLAYANPALARMTGYTAQELTSLSPRGVAELIHPEDRQMFFSRFRERLAGKNIISNYTFRGIRKDKKTIWFEISSSRVIYNGQPAVQAAFIDITGRRKVGEALKASEERYAATTQLTRAIIYDYDLKSGGINWAGNIRGLTGFSNSEFSRVNLARWAAMIHPEDRKHALAALARSKRSGKQYLIEYRFKKKSGSYFWALDAGNFLSDASRRPCRMLGMMRDIGELRKAEEALRKSEETFRGVIEASHDLIMLTHTDGSVAYVSPACKNVIGWDPKKLIGIRPAIFHHEDIAKVRAAQGSAARGRSGADLQYRIMTQNGKVRWVSHSWSPIVLPGKMKIVASVVQDITERKAGEERLIRQKEQIEELSKMRERFMADMTHELKTPLSVILLNLEMARKLDPISQKKQMRECFELMWRNSMRLSRSVDQIMQLTRLESVDVSPIRFRITNLMCSVCNEYLPLAKAKGIEFEMKGPPMEMKGNQHLLAMAVSNLVSNAIKFTSAGKVSVKWAKSNGNVVISVSDTGIGVRRESRGKIFDKFFKEDHNAPGSGIGLTISSEVVARMGGRMEFDSVPGKGSTFRIIIPQEAKK